MKKMFVLLSHTITEQQKADAASMFDIDSFEMLPTDVWSQIPAGHESVEGSLVSLKQKILEESTTGDFLFVQGDYGATYNMVQFAKEIGIIPVYATSVRKACEVVDGEKIKTVREFEHIRFRKY